MAPAYRGAFNGERLYTITWEDPAHNSGADRDQNGAPEPAAAGREVPELRLARECLVAGCKLAPAANSHALIAALHQRVALNNRRPSGGNQWSSAPGFGRFPRTVRAHILLFL